MLKVKLQYLGHLIWRADLLKNTLMLGKIEGGGAGSDRGKDGGHRWLDMSLSKLWEMIVKNREAWRAAVHGVTESDVT